MERIEAGGASIPAIGLGTWTLDDDAAEAMTAEAIRVGYRHVDTAVMYGNEAGVGAGLRAGGAARDDIFLTTKIWHDDIGAGDLQAALKASLSRLKCDHVDLALIHWPSKTIPLADSIGALNDAADQGLARHVGVSNFTIPLLEEATALSPRPIVCNQIENHPQLDQTRVIAACRAAGLAVVSYCPLSRGSGLFEEPVIARAAARHGVSPAQVVLRWHVQQEGVIAIPRTSNPARLPENIAVFDFALEAEEMHAISALGAQKLRHCDFAFSPDWDD